MKLSPGKELTRDNRCRAKNDRKFQMSNRKIFYKFYVGRLKDFKYLNDTMGSKKCCPELWLLKVLSIPKLSSENSCWVSDWSCWLNCLNLSPTAELIIKEFKIDTTVIHFIVTVLIDFREQLLNNWLMLLVAVWSPRQLLNSE